MASLHQSCRYSDTWLADLEQDLLSSPECLCEQDNLNTVYMHVRYACLRCVSVGVFVLRAAFTLACSTFEALDATARQQLTRALVKGLNRLVSACKSLVGPQQGSPSAEAVKLNRSAMRAYCYFLCKVVEAGEKMNHKAAIVSGSKKVHSLPSSRPKLTATPRRSARTSWRLTPGAGTRRSRRCLALSWRCWKLRRSIAFGHWLHQRRVGCTEHASHHRLPTPAQPLATSSSWSRFSSSSQSTT